MTEHADAPSDLERSEAFAERMEEESGCFLAYKELIDVAKTPKDLVRLLESFRSRALYFGGKIIFERRQQAEKRKQGYAARKWSWSFFKKETT